MSINTNQPGYNDFRIEVPKEYENFFTHFYFAENNSSKNITKTLLPTYQTICVFSFDAEVFLHSKQDTKIEINQCLILGPIKQAFDYSLSAGAKIMVANFKDDAFYRFFGNASIAEHLPMNPDDILNENCFSVLWNELNAISDKQLKADHILKFCTPYLRQQDSISKQLLNFKDQTLNPIKSIASLNNQSERNVQLIHKKHLGYSAKELNRHQRFLRAVELIQNIALSNSKVDWFDVISKCGYYDQSQLIHDFKHYIHLSPAKYLKFQQDICYAKS